MKCVTVINGFSDNYEKRLGEVLGLLKGLKEEMPENMIFLCREDFPKEKIKALPAVCVTAVCSDAYDAESILPVLAQETADAEIVIFDSGFAGIELAGRLAARKAGTAVTKVSRVFEKNGKLLVQKNTYSNHMTGEFAVNRMPCFITAEPGAAPAEAVWQETGCHIEIIKVKSGLGEYVLEKEESTGGLEEAEFLVAAGRGAGSKAVTEELEKLAEHMGARFGVSRPAAMNAWAPMKKLIGVSGTMAKPKICIAAGASGAPAFYAGIEKSEFIVAVNTDEKAELLKKADVAVEGDCLEILQELDRIMTK